MRNVAVSKLLSRGWRCRFDAHSASDIGLLDAPSSAPQAKSITQLAISSRLRLSTKPTLFLWLFMLSIGLLAAMAIPMFVGRVYTADDLGAFHLPIRAFYAHCLAAGDAFDWSPRMYCGFYLTGEGQLGGYHPLHLLLYRLVPLGTAFDLECLINYPLLLVGMYWLLQRWRLPRDAALFAGMALAFCGFSMLHFVHVNAVAVVAHLPWLLVALDVLLRKRSLESSIRKHVAGAAIALLTASQLLLGYPQYVVYSLLVEIGYALLILRYSAVSAGRSNNTEGATASAPLTTHRWPVAILLPAFWTALGFMIAAIQLLPTWQALGESSRQAAGASFHNSGSLHPLNLVQLLAPYLFRTRVVGQNTHELGCYAGSVTLLLAVWCIVGPKQPRRLRPLFWGALATGIVGLAIATGEFGPLTGVTAWLPIVNRMRFPCRAIVLIHFALAVLAALGMTGLRRANEPNRAGLRAIWSLVALSIALAAIGPVWWSPYIAAPPLVWTGPALIGAAALLLTLSARRIRWASFALMLLAAVDLGAYGLTNSFYTQATPLRDFVAATAAPPGPAIGRVAIDLVAPNQRVVHAGDRLTLGGWSLADGYAGLEPVRELDHRQIASLRAAGVGWVSASADLAGGSALLSPAAGWLKLNDALPRAKLFAETTASADPAHEIMRIPLESRAVVERPMQLDPGPPGTVAILDDRPGSMRLRVQAPGRRLLFVSESFHSGWKCWADGRPEPVLRVDGDFLGCLCPRGTTEICFRFQPESLRYGRLLSVCGLGLLGALVLLSGFRAPRRTKRQEGQANNESAECQS